MKRFIRINDTWYQLESLEKNSPLVIGKRVMFVVPKLSNYHHHEVRVITDFPRIAKVSGNIPCSIQAVRVFYRFYYRITGQWKIRRLNKPCKTKQK